MLNRKYRRWAMTVALIQLPMLCVIFWGDFGLVTTRSMGGIGAWCLWVLAYVIVVFGGIVLSMSLKLTRLTQAQFAAPFVMGLCHWAYFAIPERHYDAAKYQHLLGMTVEEVEAEIGKRRVMGSGLDGISTEEGPSGEWVESGFQVYNGMTILYSNEGRVVEVRKE